MQQKFLMYGWEWKKEKFIFNKEFILGYDEISEKHPKVLHNLYSDLSSLSEI